MVQKIFGTVAILVLISISCSTLPTEKHEKYLFPKDEAFVGGVERPYKVLGRVRAKMDYQSFDIAQEDLNLCKNYYNKAVKDLVKMAQKKGGDAVVDVKSVVFLENGRQEVYTTPECADDGMEGQVLTQGIAIKWISE